MDWGSEASVRLLWFLGSFLVFGLLETLRPRRVRNLPQVYHWFNNLMLVVVDSLFVRVLLPIVALQVAVLASDKGWGLLNLWTTEYKLVGIVLSVVLLDGIIYWQHRAFHVVPVLWRLHRVHHTDIDLDVSSGLRFHPVEIGISMLIKMGSVLVLGLPAEGVFVFEVILNVSAMFNHANLNLGNRLDQLIRKCIISPDMHRIHHSVHLDESLSNYGFFLSIWDRIFGSYIDKPRDGQINMKLGIEIYRDKRDQRLDQLLLQPIRKSEQKDFQKT